MYNATEKQSQRGEAMIGLGKAKKRLLERPSDYTFSEARNLLKQLGFDEYNKGKTSGSRVKFYRKSDECAILLHKPHPGDVMDKGAIKMLADRLEESGDI